jgi:hypothetical protein
MILIRVDLSHFLHIMAAGESIRDLQEDLEGEAAEAEPTANGIRMMMSNGIQTRFGILTHCSQGEAVSKRWSQMEG